MELGKRPVEGITAQSDMWIVRFAERFRVLAMSKMFQSKRNGYVDLKGGGWGVEVHNAKQEPQHGDRVWIDLAYMGMEGQSQEEFVDQVVGESTDLRGHKKYLCSIQTQKHIEKLLAQRPV